MTIITTPALLCCLLLTSPWDYNRLWCGRLFRLLATWSVRLTLSWRFIVHGPTPRQLPARVVVVANHQSYLDSFLISHLPWEMKWLAKASLFQVPFLGWNMWLAGDIAVDRGNKVAAKKAMLQARKYIRRGVPVFFFPEGRRSPNTTLLPFKNGAFRLALEEQAAILPLAVCGTAQGLAKHSFWVRPTTAMVKVGAPIATIGLNIEDIESLKKQTQVVIQDMVLCLTAAGAKSA